MYMYILIKRYVYIHGIIRHRQWHQASDFPRSVLPQREQLERRCSGRDLKGQLWRFGGGDVCNVLQGAPLLFFPALWLMWLMGDKTNISVVLVHQSISSVCQFLVQQSNLTQPWICWEDDRLDKMVCGTLITRRPTCFLHTAERWLFKFHIIRYGFPWTPNCPHEWLVG